MNHLRNLSIIILVAMFGGGAQSQDGTNPTKHFEKDGIAFDYPTDWTVIENNSPGLQVLTVAPGGNATQIVVSSYRGPVWSCDFEVEGKKIASAFSERLAKVIKAGAATGSLVTTQVDGSDIEGKQLHGFIDQQPALGDVYSIRLHGQFLSLAFVRRVDDSTANSAWQTVRSSLKVESPVIIGTMAVPLAESSGAPISGGVMNGKAISLPGPDYPQIARSAHASGVVVVQVTIDEAGDVIRAHAISGHPLLQAASVASAKQAKFSPTKLCGEPVKVTGVITYSFVAR